MTNFGDFTNRFAECMRRNNIKRADGRWSEYERAIKIAVAELAVPENNDIKDRAYHWVLPRDCAKE